MADKAKVDRVAPIEQGPLFYIVQRWELVESRISYSSSFSIPTFSLLCRRAILKKPQYRGYILGMGSEIVYIFGVLQVAENFRFNYVTLILSIVNYLVEFYNLLQGFRKMKPCGRLEPFAMSIALLLVTGHATLLFL